jgi:hypothetical protein
VRILVPAIFLLAFVVPSRLEAEGKDRKLHGYIAEGSAR